MNIIPIQSCCNSFTKTTNDGNKTQQCTVCNRYLVIDGIIQEGYLPTASTDSEVESLLKTGYNGTIKIGGELAKFAKNIKTD